MGDFVQCYIHRTVSPSRRTLVQKISIFCRNTVRWGWCLVKFILTFSSSCRPQGKGEDSSTFGRGPGEGTDFRKEKDKKNSDKMKVISLNSHYSKPPFKVKERREDKEYVNSSRNTKYTYLLCFSICNRMYLARIYQLISSFDKQQTKRDYKRGIQATRRSEERVQSGVKSVKVFLVVTVIS